jgi:anaerobic ribonucleoside-triphosphate reductase
LLCNNEENPAKNVSKEYIILTLIRIYVADILIRMLPKLVKNSVEKNLNFYKDSNFVEIIKSIFKKELQSISTDSYLALGIELDKLFVKLQTEQRLNQSLLPAEDSLTYFAKKEIKYFMKEYERICSLNTNLFDRYRLTIDNQFSSTDDDRIYENNTLSLRSYEDGTVKFKLSDSRTKEELTGQVRASISNPDTGEIIVFSNNITLEELLATDQYKFLDELYGFSIKELSSYIWLYNASNYEYATKNNFLDSKRTILKLFVQFFNETITLNSGQEAKTLSELLADNDQFRYLSQTQLETYIKNASRSPYPEIYLSSDKVATNQACEILSNILRSTAKIAKSYIERVDSAVYIGKQISRSVNIPSAILWNTLNEEEKFNKLCNSNAVLKRFYKNLEDGKSVLPEFTFDIIGYLTLSGFTGFNTPTQEWWTHLGITVAESVADTVEYSQWKSGFVKSCTHDECEVASGSNGGFENIRCNKDRKEQLIKELEDKEN